MWTRTYLVLLAIRLYLALSPSYIHPDENFQGPEVVAGKPLFTISPVNNVAVRRNAATCISFDEQFSSVFIDYHKLPAFYVM